MNRSKHTPFSIIDIGSFSIRLVIYDSISVAARTVFNEKVIINLGKVVEKKGKIDLISFNLLSDILERFISISRSLKSENLVILATAAIRNAKNNVEFVNGYTPGFGSWNGFSWSKVTDTTTPGFANQYASFTGGGSDGAGGTITGTNYAVGFGNQTFFNLPEAAELQSIDVTNTTYAGISMRDGDSFAKKFGGASGNDEDFFKLTLTGFEDLNLSGSTTGALDIYLADYRFSDNSKDYILDTWNQFDLTDLGSARSVGFSFTTTDNGDFGANTPLFVAIDNLNYSINSVPEPAAPLALSIWALALVARRSRKSSGVNSKQSRHH